MLPSAEPTGLSVDAIEKIADHFRSAVAPLARDFDKDDATLGSDLHGLVKVFNCEVKVADQNDYQLDVHGTLEVRSQDNWTIYLANHTGPLQDRFTLAHELGHYVLHSMMGHKPIRASRTFNSAETPSLAEVEADAFAFALLMPRQEFQEAIKKYGRDPFLLSAEFEVEPAIAEMRLASFP